MVKGLENAVVSNWDGWDDNGVMVIGLNACTLQPHVHARCIELGMAEHPDNIYVCFDGESSQAIVMAYTNDTDEQASFEHTFELDIKVIL